MNYPFKNHKNLKTVNIIEIKLMCAFSNAKTTNYYQ